MGVFFFQRRLFGLKVIVNNRVSVPYYPMLSVIFRKMSTSMRDGKLIDNSSWLLSYFLDCNIFFLYWECINHYDEICDKLSEMLILWSKNQTARLFVCLFGFLTSSSTTRLYRRRAPRQERLTILRAATHETELGDHDFCLSRSHYTDTDPTCRERAATAGIEPGTSSPGVARSTAELPRPPDSKNLQTRHKAVLSIYKSV